MQSLTFPMQKLTRRAAIRVDGPDARAFLQGLVTADIDALGDGKATYAALLQPQGKILFDFFVFRKGTGYLIDCSARLRDELLKRLGFYKLRAKLALEALQDDVGVSPVEPAFPDRYRDPRADALGWRLFAPAGALAEGDVSAYHTARMRLGLTGARDVGSGQLFPHEANLDQLGGVSFSKGCYVGQEVVSRMEHRGTARSRILPVHLAGEVPEAGSEIVAGDRKIGTLLRRRGEDGLALIRLDRLKDARDAGIPLLTDGASVAVIKPAWAHFDVAA